MRILNRRESTGAPQPSHSPRWRGGLSTFHREDILEAAMADETSHQHAKGISAWLADSQTFNARGTRGRQHRNREPVPPGIGEDSFHRAGSGRKRRVGGMPWIVA